MSFFGLIELLFFLWIIIRSLVSLFHNLDPLSVATLLLGFAGIWIFLKHRKWLSLVSLVISGLFAFTFGTQITSIRPGMNFFWATITMLLIFISSLLDFRIQRAAEVRVSKSQTPVLLEGFLYIGIYFLSAYWFQAFHRNVILYKLLAPVMRPTSVFLLTLVGLQLLIVVIQHLKIRYSEQERYNYILDAFWRSAVIMVLIFLSSIPS